ncbi:hypothetical protein Poli38472_005903 [Pythium oligandrum]|uniref:MYND-type domain-containing protein n=1 Tax=Pythium oligandrum TaxID=41045 RepID=A0A8K1CTL0_PYTOL|nr:hypothetical protein Poli38472_005903 [Pythium oligandrum]|eukprot:TMW68435.1 hypothetical protein Poli38472_005903 [Pythium oligandrum]
MVDSDSDDELLTRLTSTVFGRTSHVHEDCAYCATPSATLPCTTCNAAHYCNETCKRRHFAAHRRFCINTRMRNEASEEEAESSEEESDSEVEDVQPASRRGSGMMNAGSRTSRARGSMKMSSVVNEAMAASAKIQIPGLTQKQVKKLLALSAKAESMTDSKTIDDLQRQITELMAQRDADAAEKLSKLQRSESNSTTEKLNEIKELQRKLLELEQKTQTIEITTRNSTFHGGNTIRASKPVVYTPLLVKDDDVFRKYFKLKDMSMPIEQIKAKMEADGVDPNVLDNPDDVSPNDPGAPEGAYIPLLVKDDPKLKKYFKLKNMDMPLDQIRLKMEADGVDPSLLDHPAKVSPNDPGPPLYVDSSAFQDPHDLRMSMPVMGYGGMGSPSGGSDYRMSIPMMPTGMFPLMGAPPTSPTALPPYVPLLIKDDPDFKKFFKLRQMGMPDDQIKLKMSAEGLDPTVLDRPDDVSPNDKGPPAVDTAGSVPTPPMSMEHLFSILMQHQQIIQQVTSGGGGNMRANYAHSNGAGEVSAVAPKSVEDQMAQELAAAESALDDIFGEEQQSKGLGGGMSMIEQLEKKARKESNKKLVEHRDEINKVVQSVLTTTFETDVQAIAYYKEVAPQLENLGLTLGVDAVQTWSARLLIKNKDTRDWYFSESERLDAGKAYGRLWSMSFLERDAGQLIAKRTQILHAPETLRASVKNKPELIDKFTQLLKDTVKLKHKIFKSALYPGELRRLQENRLPERFEDRGTELIDATTVLSDAVLDLAEEEFRTLDQTTRAKKIRAHTAVVVAEKAIQLVGIVKKLGARGVNESRMSQVESKMQQLKDEYLSGEQEEEDEDDVL